MRKISWNLRNKICRLLGIYFRSEIHQHSLSCYSHPPFLENYVWNHFFVFSENAFFKCTRKLVVHFVAWVFCNNKSTGNLLYNPSSKNRFHQWAVMVLIWLRNKCLSTKIISKFITHSFYSRCVIERPKCLDERLSRAHSCFKRFLYLAECWKKKSVSPKNQFINTLIKS